jgi:hypothetical protein
LGYKTDQQNLRNKVCPVETAAKYASTLLLLGNKLQKNDNLPALQKKQTAQIIPVRRKNSSIHVWR